MNWYLHRTTNKDTWLDIHGRLHTIRTMRTGHIANAMGLLERKGMTTCLAYTGLKEELDRRNTQVRGVHASIQTPQLHKVALSKEGKSLLKGHKSYPA